MRSLFFYKITKKIRTQKRYLVDFRTRYLLFFIILYYPLLVFLLLKKQNFIGFFLTILNWFLQTL